jgi:hypothetical protein
MRRTTSGDPRVSRCTCCARLARGLRERRGCRETALHNAAFNGFTAVMCLLLAANADERIENQQG